MPENVTTQNYNKHNSVLHAVLREKLHCVYTTILNVTIKMLTLACFILMIDNNKKQHLAKNFEIIAIYMFCLQFLNFRSCLRIEVKQKV